MPLLIWLRYLEQAMQSTILIRLEPTTFNVDIHSYHSIGALYVICLAGLAVSGLLLVGHCRKETWGVSLLLLQRVLQFFVFGRWTLRFVYSMCLDMGCVLLLLLSKACSQHLRQQRRLQLLLLLARICMCGKFLLWRSEQQKYISDYISLCCLLLTLCGLYCRQIAKLSMFLLLLRLGIEYKFCWIDPTINLLLLSSTLCKLSGFYLLSQLGPGNWSFDAWRLNQRA
ncbi:maker434 [Drosophila busckii]|uniref:Maker434 n=2 Tax=Drosophila busckii TaxID=30019 RepID=A0A0M4EBB7_DROBS|nr:maker434 [Drosophila busckii]